MASSGKGILHSSKREGFTASEGLRGGNNTSGEAIERTCALDTMFLCKSAWTIFAAST